MKKNIISLAKLPDLIISGAYLKLFQERSSLIIFLFHGLFQNEKENTLNLVDPQPWITVKQFRKFIKYYLYYDYTFISPDDVLHGLKNNKKSIMITFDDGYYNNIYALPILKEYKIPATFFISTDHIKYNKCFWWDIIYREMRKLDISKKKMTYEKKRLKSKTNKEIENYLKKTYGEKVFEPRSNIDRPFNPSELNEFSKEKYVFLGNHTNEHAILTNYPQDGIKSQILTAQNIINDITGITPIIISYPDGSYSDEVINISKEVGLKLGITTYHKKNYFPIDYQYTNCMCLGRFDISGNENITEQCKLFRSDFLLYVKFLNLLKRS